MSRILTEWRTAEKTTKATCETIQSKKLQKANHVLRRVEARLRAWVQFREGLFAIYMTLTSPHQGQVSCV